ncbi:MAG: hypothetical protein OEM77_01160 [Nitrosopumilus sp.]|nr:hypothetical protein [Nitrosopumilus sp.]MDH3735763.1 hypothetical protein [Nitrosopumilus sp.]MDH3822406.1 hypothetical protein [Nitrosopumilus sp.]MDH3833345.1 hypothetical protein [Nitrosopumilus sp.]
MTGNTLDKTYMHFFKVTDAMTEEITCGNCGVVLSEESRFWIRKCCTDHG